MTAALEIMVNDAALTASRLIDLRDLLEQAQPAQGYRDSRAGELLIRKVMTDWDDMVQQWDAKDVDAFSSTIEVS